MRLLIIRHGDPDYAIDGLSEKGTVFRDYKNAGIYVFRL